MSEVFMHGVPMPGDVYPVAQSMARRVQTWALTHSDDTALLEEDAQWTWKRLGEAAASLSKALLAHVLRPGQRLLIVAENSAEAVIATVAAQHLGAWPAIMNARIPLAEVRKLAGCVDPHIVVFCTALSAHAGGHAKAFDATACTDELPGLMLARVGEAVAEPLREPRDGDAIGLMLFTSGTTGQSKAVMFSHSALLAMGEMISDARGTKAGDIVDVSAPFSHIMAITSLASCLQVGSALRIRPRLSPRELASAIAAGAVNQVSIVPVAWEKVLDQIDAADLDVSGHALRRIITGGAPLHPALGLRVEQRFGLPLVNAYGMTECGPIARTNGFDGSKPQSVGVPEPRVTVAIFSGGERMAPGAEGEIFVKSPAMMSGYFRNEAATAEVFPGDGWFATGDHGSIAAEGQLLITGRKKELIIRSGFNVYPAEVEAAIADHPAVMHAAVVGMPDGSGNERIAAVVQLRSSGDDRTAASITQELEAHCRQRLAAYKCPAVWRVVDQMPIGPSGKIIKRALLESVCGADWRY